MIIIIDANKFFFDFFTDRINKARWFYAPIGICLAINLIMFGVNVFYPFKHKTNFESFLWTMVKYVHISNQFFQATKIYFYLNFVLMFKQFSVQVFISCRWNRCHLDVWNFFRDFRWWWNWIQMVSLLILLLNAM